MFIGHDPAYNDNYDDVGGGENVDENKLSIF